MIDVSSATRALAELVRGVRTEQLADRTPCEAMSVGDLLHHIDGFALVFSAAARKAPLPDGSAVSPGPADVPDADWQIRIPDRLAELAHAWAEPGAWTGTTSAAGVDLTGDAAGMFALDEVIVHSWDLAVATGQAYACSTHLLELLYGFVAAVQQSSDSGPGLFGPPVTVSEDASLLHRVIGLTGRDPAWRPLIVGVGD